MVKRCHLCGEKLLKNPIITLEGIPQAAQFFLNNTNDRDKPINLVIKQCSSCGLVQHTNKPVKYYKEVITASNVSDTTREIRQKTLSKIIDTYCLKGKKVFEIGCGKGNNLDILNDLYMRPYGIEFSNQNKYNIFKNYILDKTIKGPKDFIVSFNYLEHLPNIDKVIKKIYDILSNDGLIYATVPNLGYLLDTKSYYEFVPDHISYFTKDTLSFAFHKNGFDVLINNIINDKNDIEILARKRSKIIIDNEETKSIIRELKSITSKYNRVAIFGAGHRTLTLLSLLKDTNNIKYIVDSCQFKQFKYSSITHLRILPEESLIRNPVDLLLIMVPGIFPKDVVEKIKKLRLSCDIGTLKDNKILIEKINNDTNR
jgi:SAM-dependent methyltransferase